MNCGRARVSRALFFVHARKWLTVIPREHIHFMFLEDLITDVTGSARAILKFLDLDTSITAKPAVIKKVADSCGKNPQKKVDYKNNPKLQMRQDTRDLLRMFFEPFNMLLARLLGRTLPFVS